MTIGIYKLSFEGTDKVYIGQSIDIERRYSEHKRLAKLGKMAKKLQEAYNLYGLPAMEILAECEVSELNDLETEGISIFNSYTAGFNGVERADDMPTLQGTEAPNAKLTKEQILLAIDSLGNSAISVTLASEISGVPTYTIQRILRGAAHLWVFKEYPNIFTNAINNAASREKLHHKAKGEANKLSGSILQSAKAKGITYPKVISSTGDIFNVDCVAEFVRVNNLNYGNFYRVLTGERKTHKGWKLCQNVQV